MGWWSATIMGGDSPLNWEYNFNDIVGVVSGELKAIDINNNIQDMIKFIRKTGFDIHVGWQVLGVLILRTGACMPDLVRKEILENICNEKDMGWTNLDEREFYLADFRSKIINYKNGEIVEITSEDIFEKIIKGEGIGYKREEGGVLISLQEEIDKILQYYLNEVNETANSRVKYHQAIRNMILDIMHICKKYKVDFIGTSADAIELFEKEVNDE